MKTHRMAKWSRSIAVMLIAMCMCLTMIPPASTLAGDQVSDTNSSDDTGMKAASWALTAPYCATKAAFAVAAALSVAWDTLFLAETQELQSLSGPPAFMGPTSSDQPISEARNRSTSSARLRTGQASR